MLNPARDKNKCKARAVSGVIACYVAPTLRYDDKVGSRRYKLALEAATVKTSATEFFSPPT